MKSIYLDHAATTPIHPEVINDMVPVLEETFGNPSSIHQYGRKARQILDVARDVIAKSIGANEKEIIFTSGGTEADNLALIGSAYANMDKGKHIVTTMIEHHAILHAAEFLEKQGFTITYLPVNENGRINLDELSSALTDETTTVSVMHVNNETGMVQPIKEIGELLREHQAYFHTDAVQAYGVLPIDVNKLGIDLLAASSHKINGPKGLGFLYVKDGVRIDALQYGGEQERKRRPGTENVAGIKGFQRAVELLNNTREEKVQTHQMFLDLFLKILETEGISFSINGDRDHAVSSIINISFPGTNVESLLTNFDLAGIAASSGSACTAGSVEPSHVLSAMYGDSNERTTNSIRFSFGLANNQDDIEEAAMRVASIVQRVKR
ncbi:cysteine desulfurase family protein [Terrihalobacillus insolitus]|uniref:cysteine desulfurase family protein n=1 Tax=Terrihalobacillus insolitus TaxID=2950438 RepID=UPI00233F9273|nr:cysteine desulfurase family protein [Terrihalobacillus insolitus]MDC3413287.1 cysteine desulfurase [Terrihalobacillus insolitus]